MEHTPEPGPPAVVEPDQGDFAPEQPGPPPGDALATPFGPIALSERALCGFGLLLGAAVVLPLLATHEAVDLLASLVVLPAVGALLWARVFRADVVSTSQLFVRFVLGWTVVMPVALFFAMVLLTFASIAISAAAFVFHLPGVVIASLLLLCVMGCVVLCEEICKVLVLSRLDTHSVVQVPRHFTLYSAATSLGIATGECFYLVLFLRLLIDAAASATAQRVTMAPSGAGGYETVAAGDDASVVTAAFLLILTVNAMVFLIPMHMLTAYHMGLAVTRSTHLGHSTSVAAIVAIAVLMRTLFGFSFFECLFVLRWGPFSTIVACLFQGIYYLLVKRYQDRMPRDYLRRAGYMSFLGYGALPTEEEEEREERGPEVDLEAQMDAVVQAVPEAGPSDADVGGVPAAMT